MKSKGNIITVFLGLFNAEKYLDSLFDQIISQSNQNFNLLVVDNNSSDKTFQNVKKWRNTFSQRLQIVRNPINYGAYGSLFKNIEKIKTPWFCWIHQDDIYKPNHINTFLEIIPDVGKDIIGISTTMGSLTNNGKILNSKPRITWFASELNQAGQFLQNLKAQAFPDPASAYKLDIFKKTIIPFHSSAFPDTEHTLRMLGYGKFIVSQKETMLYRENPLSISHVLNQKERLLGAAVSLIRVFNSEEFEILLSKIKKEKRGEFTKQLLDALSLRFPDSDLLKVIELSALEKISLKWGYEQKNVSKLLLKKYSVFSSSLTVSTLSNLSKLEYPTVTLKTNDLVESVSAKSKIWNLYFNLECPIITKYNKKILTTVYRFIFIFEPKHRWKNRWK
jgi:glycosyltransferase involved in cell wall biosynthesis